MNYVERHFGDWARDTAHLSMLEDGAYNRLCDLYYVRETPLPSDLLSCCRLVRASSKPERDAVRVVLGEFFVETPNGWRHKRCDAEIARFREGEPEREVKKANEDNRMKRHREERARLFKVITDAGQHAAWNMPMADLRQMVERLTATTPATQPETASVTQTATAPATPATATHSPLPTTQYSKEEKPPATRVPLWAPPAWMPLQQWAGFVAMRKAKGKRAPFTDEARDGIVAALDKLRAAGHDIGAALQESVNNGWSGVFAPKAQRTETLFASDRRAQADAWMGSAGPRVKAEVIDMEDANARLKLG